MNTQCDVNRIYFFIWISSIVFMKGCFSIKSSSPPLHSVLFLFPLVIHFLPVSQMYTIQIYHTINNYKFPFWIWNTTLWQCPSCVHCTHTYATMLYCLLICRIFSQFSLASMHGIETAPKWIYVNTQIFSLNKYTIKLDCVNARRGLLYISVTACRIHSAKRQKCLLCHRNTSLHVI